MKNQIEYFLLVGFLFVGLTACTSSRIYFVDRNGLGLPDKTFSENNFRLGITIEGHCSAYKEKKVIVKEREVTVIIVESLLANQPKELSSVKNLLLHLRIANPRQEDYSLRLESSLFKEQKDIFSGSVVEKLISVSMPLVPNSWIKTNLLITRGNGRKSLKLGPFIYRLREKKQKGGEEKNQLGLNN